MNNPLFRDESVDFLLQDVLDLDGLLALPAFEAHDRETIGLFLDAVRRVARERLYPAYRPMDESPARFSEGRVTVHPRLHAFYPDLRSLGMVSATRPVEVGGQGLPLTVATVASAYLMAANLSAYAYVGLSAGAGHLIEAFGDEALKATYLPPLYEGRWMGTMALTEPQAGSSLGDLTSRATPRADGRYAISGAKIFISGGDHDLTENIVHLVLARIDGAPVGTAGISLFCVPKRRQEGDAWVDNDVTVTGLIHKIGWKGLPSLALAFGDRGECLGHLVGQPNKGLAQMFQMMNEARIMVGVNGVATASVAYQESLSYAQTRTQGRPLGQRGGAPVPIVAHADVRRMLLRQKAIVDGGLALVAYTARCADLAAHAADPADRQDAQRLLDLLTPVAKTFPAERGFESNALALQIHGGYGYSSEYGVEAWLRDQKLNTIHEGTTGIQGLDLLGRKILGDGGLALGTLARKVADTIEDARRAGLDEALTSALGRAVERTAQVVMALGQRGQSGDTEGMLLHSTDFLDLFGILVVAWQHLGLAARAQARLSAGDPRGSMLRGTLRTAEYWLGAELPRLHALAETIERGEPSFRTVRVDEL